MRSAFRGQMLSNEQIGRICEVLENTNSNTTLWVVGCNLRVVDVAIFTVLINADRMDFASLFDREVERHDKVAEVVPTQRGIQLVGSPHVSEEVDAASVLLRHDGQIRTAVLACIVLQRDVLNFE